MRIPTLLIAFLAAAFTTTLFAQVPSITSVEPAAGPVGGGTTITINGQNLANGRCEGPPAPPCIKTVVYVGGRKAQVISVTATAITALTSPYTHGRFDVSVYRENDRAFTSLENAFTYGQNWERVLLPVYLAHDLPGAAGSLWRTELDGYADFQAFVTSNPGGALCISCGNNVTGPFRASTLVSSDMHVPGRLVWFASAYPSLLTFNLRVRDVSRATENLGTEIRTVPEDDAIGPLRSIALSDVPLGTLYRAKLRLYQVDGAEGRTLSVFFYRPDVAYQTAVATRNVTLTREPETVYPGYPGYAELDLETIAELAAMDRVTVVVRTPEEGEYWALVSVTNNKTQQITTVSP